MYYDNQCGSCENFEEMNSNSLYDTSRSENTKGYCTHYREYYYPTDSCDDFYKSRANYSTCYLTTIICSRLKMSDNCHELETLRKFRRDILQKDEKYKGLLFEYDLIGPQISRELEKEDINIIKKLFNTFILPITQLIEEKNYVEAVDKYRYMTTTLEECYGLSFDDVVPKNYNYQVGGHGRVKKFEGAK